MVMAKGHGEGHSEGEVSPVVDDAVPHGASVVKARVRVR